MISRTGYTGEDGFEVIVGGQRRARGVERALESGKPHGIQACGLGARDTLRLEAAMPLYGHELSESINPYAAGVGWAVKLDKGEFAGRSALTAWQGRARSGSRRPEAGSQADRPARGGRVLAANEQVGEVTSGTFSPTLASQPGDGAGRSRRGRGRHRA